MKKTAFALVTGLALTLPSMAFAQSCTVMDPTGSPLNIRQSPNGKIVGKLRNGTRVVVHDYDYDRKGRPWAYVTSNRGAGWVFREFIACY